MKFVIGDIHGEISKLTTLVDFVKEMDSKAEFIFIGDYIDKGENPKETLDYLMELDQSSFCQFLMGNHEYYWIKYTIDNNAIGEYLLKYGGKQTINSFNKNASIMETKNRMITRYSQIFNNLIPFWTNEKYFISHSGIRPQDIDVVPANIKIENFLFNRYDFIKMNKFYGNHKLYIFGHTGFYSPFFDGYKIGIDTAACFLEDQPLTAFCLDGCIFLNSNRTQFSLNSINRNCSPVIPRVKPWRMN